MADSRRMRPLYVALIALGVGAITGSGTTYLIEHPPAPHSVVAEREQVPYDVDRLTMCPDGLREWALRYVDGDRSQGARDAARRCL